jgi:hypothetical protein
MPVALKEKKSKISESELAQRVAVVKRFKELLVQQRDRFQSYLTVLDKQQLLIGYGSADEITAHVELEEQIVADIFSIQKVIEPMEVMYNAAGGAIGDATGAASCDLSDLGTFITINDVPALKASLEDLKTQAAVRSGQNRDLLSKRMEEINTNIQTIKNNPFLSKARNALYRNVSPSMIDITG